uniref:Uncharacterized protein n=1 Tax=Fervidicoccus fontis TaxID=683846 RepID=A0A7J3SM35_9CREN
MPMEQTRFRILFYPEHDAWVIVDVKTNTQLIYHLNQVEVDTIMYCAYLYKKVDKNITWEMLSDENREELLSWFENEVFPSEYFGKLILSDVLEEIENAKNLKNKKVKP